MNEKVTASAELLAKLAKANGDSISLCDESGNVVGYVLTPAQMANMEPKRQAPWTEEEMDRLDEERANDPRPDVPHEEVLRWFEEQ